MQYYLLQPKLSISISSLLFISFQIIKFDFSSDDDYQASSDDFNVFITFAYTFVVISIYIDFFWKFGDTLRSNYHNNDSTNTFTILARYLGEHVTYQRRARIH